MSTRVLSVNFRPGAYLRLALETGFSGQVQVSEIAASFYELQSSEIAPMCMGVHGPEAFSLKFPGAETALKKYDVVIFGDTRRILFPEDQLRSIKEYVEKGGGFMMTGGWFSFAGHDPKTCPRKGATGKAVGGWHGSVIEEILPVQISEEPDEVDVGFKPEAVDIDHPIMKGIPWKDCVMLCGYNKVKLKSGATSLLRYNGNPILAVWDYGKGRTAAFTSSFNPHWVGNFTVHDWPPVGKFVKQLILWLSQRI